MKRTVLVPLLGTDNDMQWCHSTTHIPIPYMTVASPAANTFSETHNAPGCPLPLHHPTLEAVFFNMSSGAPAPPDLKKGPFLSILRNSASTFIRGFKTLRGRLVLREISIHRVIPTTTKRTHPAVESFKRLGIMVDLDSSLLTEKEDIAFMNEYGILGLSQFAFNVQTSLEATVHVEPVVEDDSKKDRDRNGDGDGDGDDSLLLRSVKFDWQSSQQQRIPTCHPKIDAKSNNISQDRFIGSPSYQIYPLRNEFRNYMQRRSDNIQTRARLHAVQQQQEQQLKEARARPNSDKDEYPEPMGKSRPSVLSGLGRSSPLRNSWTMDNI